jgi:hypothetical protein
MQIVDSLQVENRILVGGGLGLNWIRAAIPKSSHEPSPSPTTGESRSQLYWVQKQSRLLGVAYCFQCPTAHETLRFECPLLKGHCVWGRDAMRMYIHALYCFPKKPQVRKLSMTDRMWCLGRRGMRGSIRVLGARRACSRGRAHRHGGIRGRGTCRYLCDKNFVSFDHWVRRLGRWSYCDTCQPLFVG